MRQRKAQADLVRVVGQHGLARDDDEARAVVVGVLDVGGDHLQPVERGGLRRADRAEPGRRVLRDVLCGGGGIRERLRGDAVFLEVRAALRERLLLRDGPAHRPRARRAAQAVPHRDVRRADDEHAVPHDEVVHLGNAARIRVFDGHNAVVARAAAHRLEDVAEAGQKRRLRAGEQPVRRAV